MWIDTVGLKCILKNLLNYLTPSLWNMLEKNKMYELNKIQNAIKECIKLQDSMLDNIFLLVNSPKSVELIRKDLTGVVNPLLLHVIKQLPEEMKVNLLPNIIEVMKNLDGNTKLCQDIILSIDKNWLKKNIWLYTKDAIDDQDYQNIGIFIYLFKSISEELSNKLALLALKSNVEDVREIGEMYFDKMAVYCEDDGIAVDIILSCFGSQKISVVYLESEECDEKMKTDINFIISHQIELLHLIEQATASYIDKVYKKKLDKLTLIKIYLFPDVEYQYGFLFDWLGDIEHGIGVKIKNLKVEDIGGAEIAFL
ncbi:hypothetical protein [Gilliamella sp. wkB292]|uniref:hypothetical protein n=1 Tax=Gilliamella sp. wkB292 TaxID=3120262 RepID=UPI0026A2E3E0